MSENDTTAADSDFDVERIIGVRVNAATQVQEYRIRWRHYTPADDTWEPQENLGPGCELMIQKFFDSQVKNETPAADTTGDLGDGDGDEFENDSELDPNEDIDELAELDTSSEKEQTQKDVIQIDDEGAAQKTNSKEQPEPEPESSGHSQSSEEEEEGEEPDGPGPSSGRRKRTAAGRTKTTAKAKASKEKTNKRYGPGWQYTSEEPRAQLRDSFWHDLQFDTIGKTMETVQKVARTQRSAARQASARLQNVISADAHKDKTQTPPAATASTSQPVRGAAKRRGRPRKAKAAAQSVDDTPTPDPEPNKPTARTTGRANRGRAGGRGAQTRTRGSRRGGKNAGGNQAAAAAILDELYSSSADESNSAADTTFEGETIGQVDMHEAADANKECDESKDTTIDPEPTGTEADQDAPNEMDIETDTAIGDAQAAPSTTPSTAPAAPCSSGSASILGPPPLPVSASVSAGAAQQPEVSVEREPSEPELAVKSKPVPGSKKGGKATPVSAKEAAALMVPMTVPKASRAQVSSAKSTTDSDAPTRIVHPGLPLPIRTDQSLAEFCKQKMVQQCRISAADTRVYDIEQLESAVLGGDAERVRQISQACRKNASSPCTQWIRTEQTKARLLHMFFEVARTPCNAQHTQESILRLFVEEGLVTCVNVPEPSTGRTALHWAIHAVPHHDEHKLSAEYGLCKVRCLLDLRPLLTCLDWNKQAPLHMAIEKGHKLLVQLLLDAGADFNHIVQLNVSNNGVDKLLITPLQYAERLKLHNVHKQLEDHQNRVQQSFEAALRTALRDIIIYRSISPLHCYALWESLQIKVFFDHTPAKVSERALFVVAIGLAKFSDKQQVTTALWGQSPVERVEMNGQVLKSLATDPDCRFIFGCQLQRDELNPDDACQKVHIKLKPNHAQSLNKLLVQVYLLALKDTELYRENRNKVLGECMNTPLDSPSVI